MEYQVAQPCDRKMGVVTEGPFGGNLRVKVKVGPGEEMVRAESPAARFGTGSRQKVEMAVKSEPQGPMKEEPAITEPVGGSPQWWGDGLRPTLVKE